MRDAGSEGTYFEIECDELERFPRATVALIVSLLTSGTLEQVGV
jgi:hypothetical protein